MQRKILRRCAVRVWRNSYRKWTPLTCPYLWEKQTGKKTTVFEPQGREFDRTPAYSVRKGIKPGFSRKKGNDLTLAVEEEN